MDISEIRTLMRVIFKVLIKFDVIKTVSPKPRMQLYGFEATKKCEYHQREIGHDIEECVAFKAEVQRYLTLRVLVIERSQTKIAKKETCVIKDNGSLIS